MIPFAAFWGLPVAWILLTGATVGDPVASKSAEALRLFEEGAFDQALQLYRDAQLERPDEPALNFNVGSSLFKQGDLEAALQELSRAAEQAEGILGASAHYNMGNAWFQQQQYEQAIASYRQALERNSNDRDTKANLELALQKLEEQQQQEQQQEQSQDQDEQNQEQNQQGGEEQQQQDGEEQQEQDGAGEQEPGEQEPENDEPQEQESSQPDDGSGEEGKPEQSEEQIGQKEAEQLLEALKNREIDAQKRRYRATGASRGKDW